MFNFIPNFTKTGPDCGDFLGLFVSFALRSIFRTFAMSYPRGFWYCSYLHRYFDKAARRFAVCSSSGVPLMKGVFRFVPAMFSLLGTNISG